MDDYQVIEIIDAVQTRLRADVPDIDQRAAQVVRVDYRQARPAHLQECLVEIVRNLDARKPDQLRTINRFIVQAESLHSAVAGRTAPWLMQETQAVIPDPVQDEKLGRSLRYLSLPGDSADKTAQSIPARFGQELSECVSLRSAVLLTRKRLPVLKGVMAYQFLAAIGYPVAVPSADAQRFCRNVAMVNQSEKSGEEYLTILDRAARLTGVPVAQLGYLLSVYSGGSSLTGYTPVCTVKNPRCEACSLSPRCSAFAARKLAAPEPVRGRPIHEWSPDERPRERLLAGERLSNSELLAIILRTGTGKLSAVELAREVLHEFRTLHDLEKASPHDIVTRMRGKGIGPAKAVEICAAIELGRRVTQPAADTRLGLKQVGSSRDVFEMCRARYKAATQEEFLLLVLNTKNRVQKEVSVSIGTLNSSIVHPRDVFRHALREAAAAVIFVHNHPSGDPSPSDEDIMLTARLVDAGKLLGIQVLDHVIIGSHEWYSFADHSKLR